MAEKADSGVDGLFELRMIGKLSPDNKKPAPENPALAQQRHDQETGRRTAVKYAEEMLLMLVGIARDPANDLKHRISCADKIMNRAWGQTKALTEDEKKGADAGSILDVLAAVSTTALASERQMREIAALPQGEEEISTDAEAVKFLEELNGRLDSTGETYDNE